MDPDSAGPKAPHPIRSPDFAHLGSAVAPATEPELVDLERDAGSIQPDPEKVFFLHIFISERQIIYNNSENCGIIMIRKIQHFSLRH